MNFQYQRTDIAARCTSEFSVEFVWKAATFDRMRAALKTFVRDSSTVSSHIYHRILGQEAEETEIAAKQPQKDFCTGIG